MSKNPYFAHLPTWRNRQDLAYAIDSLPTILENLTASSPLLATYSYPSTSSAMAYLIEILQSLQKEPCGCDLVKGCYCGQDGIEDHEGKSPCYVCGEWYLDRRESSHSEGEGGGGYECGVDGARGGGGGGGSAQRQGKAWHEQGSLRHHVAEAKVKKWLDSVWKPPLAPATTPEQENVRQFGLRSQEDLRQCFDHPQHQHQNQQRQQQQQVRMEPGRPWSVHDIEIEARAKSRSRNNSASSTNSLSFVSSSSSSSSSSTYSYSTTTSASPSYSTSSYSSVSPQQDLSGSAYGYASGSGSWHFNTSSVFLSSPSKPIQATPPSQRTGPLFWVPQPAPIESRGFSSFGFDSQQQQGYQARVRTMSCSDAPPPSGSKPPSCSSAPLRSSTPPVMRSHNMRTSHINSINSTSNSSNGSCRSKPVRASTANSTFAIPQEILDPSYKSPTFRIKSWNPASPASSTNHSPTASSSSPIASRLAFAKESSSADPQQEKKKQTLDRWTSAPAQPAAVAAPPPSSSLFSSAQESVFKSSKIYRSDQEDSLELSSPDAGGQQGNTREDLSSISKAFPTPTAFPTPPAETGARLEAGMEIKKNAPFQLNFTSSRFRAAVQAKASLDNHKSARRESVKNSAVFPNDDAEEEEIRALPRPIPQLAASEDNVGDRKKANIPIVDVVIVTEQVVLRDSDKAAAGRKEHFEPTTTDVIAQFKTTSTQTVSSRTLSIQKSAPLSSPILPTSTNASASVKTSSSSSSAASTSTSTSASASSLTSQLCSREPKSPKKETGKNASDVHQTTSWSSLQKLMGTVAVSATAAGPSSPAAAAKPVLGQSISMLHLDAFSSLAS
ncbi:hypothetical protein KI688_011692 [Linnemannia hyalina]|uniref:Uncharacterized protein n=1 Tax=Linnemannia hyalina TaxID=64524 RepID=A0A9P7XVH0_9FUNG|nr:hypothetical protein KI688_011692 [Linnemannia hyalina]